METKQQDVMALLKLYELRREELMRQARAWFVSEFNPQSAKEMVKLILSGQKQSAYYRMVASYWDNAASFVNNGGIDEKMFLEANSEHVAVFAKLQTLLPQVREMIGEPNYLMNLERLVMRVPDVEKKLENQRKLMKRWARTSEAAAAQTNEVVEA